MITIIVTKEEVNIFKVPDTEENRAAIRADNIHSLILDENDYYINLVDSYTTDEQIEVYGGR